MLTEAYGHKGKQPAYIIYLTRALVRVLRQGLVIWDGFKLAILLLQPSPSVLRVHVCTTKPRYYMFFTTYIILYHIILYVVLFPHIFVSPLFQRTIIDNLKRKIYIYIHIYLVMHVNTYQYCYMFNKEERKKQDNHVKGFE